jgi:hypothetical protein
MTPPTNTQRHTMIEVDLRPGIPSLTVVGAPDSLSMAVADALRARRRLPMQRVTIFVPAALPDVMSMRRAVEAKADAQTTEGMPDGYSERPLFQSETGREQVIETGRNLEPETFDAEACAARPGKYQGADDLALVVALDIINGHGGADENTGDAAITGYAWRVDRFIGIENSQGFVTAEEYPTTAQAVERLRDFDVPAEDEESEQ